MNKRFLPFLIGLFFFFPVSGFSVEVISDAELDKITGQTGIVLNVVLDALIDDDYSQLTEEEQAGVREMMTVQEIVNQRLDSLKY